MNPTTPIIPTSSDITKLQFFLDNGLDDEARKLIKKHNWALKISDDRKRLIEVSGSTDSWLRAFVTNDPDMVKMKGRAKLLADKTLNDEVLIYGPTGTGKELIAKALHNDREGKIIAVNCAGLPEHLIESELFGHVQGAFTGATREKDGLMSAAKFGTLFLDEIGELPLQVQAKLLRAIQEREIRKVGGDKDIPITCRIVAATHRNLVQMMEAESFRADLFARISTFELNITPLSDRPNDIELILRSLDNGVEYVEKYLSVSQSPIKELPTPFNVRSLQQYVKRFKVLGIL